ncbi:helix-turn-helix domain-containing protein [Fusibacter bizertensis]
MDGVEYSQLHAARLFKETIGKTPIEYIRALRLTEAALVPRDNDERIIDVALDFVFDSHEGLMLIPRQFSGSSAR